MTDAPNRFHLPSEFVASGDPVDGNPFPPDHRAHDVWNEATREAEARAALAASRAHSSHAPENVHTWLQDLAVEKFDIWSQRGVHVVWTDAAVLAYDQWLRNYANSWIDTGARHFLAHPPPFSTEWALTDLRNKLGARVQFWRAEARRYRAEQLAEQIREREHTESRMPTETVSRPATASGANVFRRRGKQWVVAFAGEPIHVFPDRSGMELIHRIVSAPGKQLAAAALMDRERVDAPVPDALSPLEALPARSMGLSRESDRTNLKPGVVRHDGDEVLDRKAQTALRNRLASITEFLDEAKASGNIGEIERLNEEREKIQEHIRKNYFQGRSRRLGSDAEKVSNSARQAYKRGLERIERGGLGALAAHLRESVHQGASSFIYAPSTDIRWET